MLTCLSPNGGVSSRGDQTADVLMVATIRGVYTLRRNSGAHATAWEVESASLEHKHISALLHEPHSGLLFAGIHGRGEDGGLFVSADLGKTWEERMTGLNSSHVYTLAAQQRPEGIRLYAGTEPPAVYRSDDLGETWVDLSALREVPGTEKWIFPPPPHIAHVKNVAFHPSEPDTLYVCVEQGAVLKSVDAGQSWVELDAYASVADSFYHDVHRVAICAGDTSRLFLATGDGLYSSRDAGETWVHLQGRKDRVGYPDALYIDPHDDAVVYMGGAHDAPETWRSQGGAFPGFIVSRDSGQTWSEAMNGLAQPIHGNIEAMNMHVGPENVSFFAGTAVGDVFMSGDSGENWVRIAHGLPPISKSRHYRHFLDAEEKLRIEDQARQERRAEGLAPVEYHGRS